MRRVLYLWLKHWPIDRICHIAPRDRQNSRNGTAVPAEAAPFATVAAAAGRQIVAAINPAAAAAGLFPGMPLADARAFVPALATMAAQPMEDTAALRRLAEWCGRYSPWTAPDGADGVRIDITGCAHLWGGEEALATDLAARLERQGIAGRVAIADTLGAAWAMARFAPAEGCTILPPGDEGAGLAALPIEALRLDPATAGGLRRVGLKRVGDLAVMPRAALARRFGENVALRLDQARGTMPEPLSPLGVAPCRRVRLSFAEPIADPDALGEAAERLARDLVCRLAEEGTGARRLDLDFHRIDGRVERIRLGTVRPSRDWRHLARLLKERLDTIDPGLGVEDMILAAFAVEPLPPAQLGFAGRAMGDAAPLLDRLGNRLGLDALWRLEPRASHIPERASIKVSVGPHPGPPPWPRGREGPAQRESLPRTRSGGGGQAFGKPPRPIRLFDPPEPVDAFWLLPDDPPFRFVWRRQAHRVRFADGPERIAEEWWHGRAREEPGAAGAIRDYYRVESEDGRRFWLFRAGLAGGSRPPHWFVHGLFA